MSSSKRPAGSLSGHLLSPKKLVFGSPSGKTSSNLSLSGYIIHIGMTSMSQRGAKYFDVQFQDRKYSLVEFKVMKYGEERDLFTRLRG